MDRLDFWQQAALYAMQGIQEAGNYFGTIVDFTPKILVTRAFDIADAMLDEMIKRSENMNFDNEETKK